MTFRDDDDDTSSGKTTQGGGRGRGNSIFWAMGAGVIALAVIIAIVTLPKKHSTAEEGTAPVSSSLRSAGSSGPAGGTAASTSPPS